ncbi:MAG: cytochrome c maturation protein CcmE [Clostridia bacterium]|nr:cytochrome c maturation protein CcmE [Clostridia bacterium]
MKRRLILVLIIVAAFAVFAFGAFRTSLTPYVTFTEAETRGGAVQVSGTVDPGSAETDVSTGVFRFRLTDRDGRMMRVEFREAPPSNFDQAESVVVVGLIRGDVFEARKILVKCPSKYQGGATK